MLSSHMIQRYFITLKAKSPTDPGSKSAKERNLLQKVYHILLKDLVAEDVYAIPIGFKSTDVLGIIGIFV